MSNETFNINSAKQVSVFSSLSKGLSALFNNLSSFLSMCYFPILNIISMTLMVSPAFILKTSFGFFNFILAGVLFIAGFIMFLVTFWKSLLGLVAISYLAKDIYENKPIQNPSDYFSYVEEYSYQYLKFNLWVMLFGILYSLAFVVIISLTTAFSILIHTPFLAAAVVLLLGLFFLAVVVFGLLFSYIFWAYENKDDNVSVIKNALSFSIKNIFSVFVLFLILTSIIPAVFYFVILIPTGFIYGLEAAKIGSSAIGLIIGWFVYYFTMFVATSYYLDIKNR